MVVSSQWLGSWKDRPTSEVGEDGFRGERKTWVHECMNDHRHQSSGMEIERGVAGKYMAVEYRVCFTAYQKSV